MTATDTKAETAARVLQAVQNLTPIVHDNWAAIDNERTLPDPVREALFGTGLLKVWLRRTEPRPRHGDHRRRRPHRAFPRLDHHD
jgi:hypothetical protein